MMSMASGFMVIAVMGIFGKMIVIDMTTKIESIEKKIESIEFKVDEIDKKLIRSETRLEFSGKNFYV